MIELGIDGFALALPALSSGLIVRPDELPRNLLGEIELTDPPDLEVSV